MRFRSTSWSFGLGLVVGSLSLICYNFVRTNEQQAICEALSRYNVSNVRPIKCWIEGRRKLGCLKEGSDVYLPFNKFVRKQFEVYGRVVNENTINERFEYYTSYSKSKRPDIRNYSSVGVFGNFGSFNVEKRERVRCMNGAVGLPMSCQWNTTPYFYPVQIAQFGLQHYSRFITDPPSKTLTLKTDSVVARSHAHVVDDEVVLDATSDFVSFDLTRNTHFPVVRFQWLPLSSSSQFTFIIYNTEEKHMFALNYVFSDKNDCLWTTHTNEYFYSLGTFTLPTNFSSTIHDINVDAMKALALNVQSPGKKDPLETGNTQTEQYMPISVTFRGPVRVKLPIFQQLNAHKELFLLTANWLVENQGSHGGWAVPVARDVAGIKKSLQPGWISAMGQGHGLSILVRAYNITGDERYADAANKALQPFETEAVDGGVRNHFLGLPCPTQPASLVLNGFIYSMIGLYDMSTMPFKLALKAKQFFEAGLDSLRLLLPLYDTGRGSTYDLKHATARIVPNLARPDYHKAHVYLLKWLHVITNDEMFQQFSSRWYGYSIGDHAKNNG